MNNNSKQEQHLLLKSAFSFVLLFVIASKNAQTSYESDTAAAVAAVAVITTGAIKSTKQINIFGINKYKTV